MKIGRRWAVVCASCVYMPPPPPPPLYLAYIAFLSVFCSIYFSLVYFAPLSHSTLSVPLFDVVKTEVNKTFNHCGKYVYQPFQHKKFQFCPRSALTCSM